MRAVGTVAFCGTMKLVGRYDFTENINNIIIVTFFFFFFAFFIEFV